MKYPLVSVVIPCFNQAHYLASSIDSVASQSWSAVEIIVVDDGSSDETLQVARGYQNVRIVSQKNAGLAAARNRGLELCTGECVVFLDADDRLLPSALQAGVSCLDRNPEAAFTWGRYRLLDGDSAVDVRTGEVNDQLSPYQKMLQGNYIAMHATVMYRRSAIAASGGFDEKLRACEDYDLYLRIAREHSIVHHEQLVAEYRRHDSNMSHDSPMMLESALMVLASQESLTRSNVSHERSRRAGINHWKQFYGLRAFRRLFRQIRSGRIPQARSDFQRILIAVGPGHLLVHFPFWVVSHLLRKQADMKLSRQS